MTLYDDKGNILESEPNNFSIMQGIGGIGQMQTLPYNYGIEIKQKSTGKIVFSQVKVWKKTSRYLSWELRMT